MAAVSRVGFPDYGDWRMPEGNALLGEGTFGKVYEARSRRGSLLAVKVATTRDGMEKLGKEYRILNGPLKDAPNTIHVRDLYASSSKVALLMDRLPAPNLWQQRRQHPEMFTFPVICDIARQGFEALRHYKTQNLVHSDITPANCSFDGERFTFFDFGVSFFHPEEKWTNGTIGYRAPETLCKETPPNHEADMWAFGALLVAAYVGGPMFINSEGKACANEKELIWAFGAEFGDLFTKYVGRLFLQSEAECSEEACFERGKVVLQKLFPNGELEAATALPWCEEIAKTAKWRKEDIHVSWLLQFLKRIFVMIPKERMTPEEGLTLLSTLREQQIFSDAFFSPRENEASALGSAPESTAELDSLSPDRCALLLDTDWLKDNEEAIIALAGSVLPNDIHN